VKKQVFKLNSKIGIKKLVLEPYAMKVARTVLRGGKFVRTYLSQLDTQLPLTVNDEW